MKNLSLNERAKRGIPTLAITKNRISSSKFEGFDSNGRYWYKTDSMKMEPQIPSGSYLCLKPISANMETYGVDGEVYLFAVRTPRGGIDAVLGNVTSKRGSRAITLHTTYPFACENVYEKSRIVEVYLVVSVMTILSPI